jgi:hypothetical protein
VEGAAMCRALPGLQSARMAGTSRSKPPISAT